MIKLKKGVDTGFTTAEVAQVATQLTAEDSLIIEDHQLGILYRWSGTEFIQIFPTPIAETAKVAVSTYSEFTSAITALNSLGGGEIVMTADITMTGNLSTTLNNIKITGQDFIFDLSNYFLEVSSDAYFGNVVFRGNNYNGTNYSVNYEIIRLPGNDFDATFAKCKFQGFLSREAVSGSGTALGTPVISARGLRRKISLIECSIEDTLAESTYPDGSYSLRKFGILGNDIHLTVLNLNNKSFSSADLTKVSKTYQLYLLQNATGFVQNDGSAVITAGNYDNFFSIENKQTTIRDLGDVSNTTALNFNSLANYYKANITSGTGYYIDFNEDTLARGEVRYVEIDNSTVNAAVWVYYNGSATNVKWQTQQRSSLSSMLLKITCLNDVNYTEDNNLPMLLVEQIFDYDSIMELGNVSGTLQLGINDSSIFNATITGATFVTISGSVPTGYGGTWVLNYYVNAGQPTPTFDSNIKFSSLVPPATSGTLNQLWLTYDGANWIGNITPDIDIS